jgi:hypothetical protein
MLVSHATRSILRANTCLPHLICRGDLRSPAPPPCALTTRHLALRFWRLLVYACRTARLAAAQSPRVPAHRDAAHRKRGAIWCMLGRLLCARSPRVRAIPSTTGRVLQSQSWCNLVYAWQVAFATTPTNAGAKREPLAWYHRAVGAYWCMPWRLLHCLTPGMRRDVTRMNLEMWYILAPPRLLGCPLSKQDPQTCAVQ